MVLGGVDVQGDGLEDREDEVWPSWEYCRHFGVFFLPPFLSLFLEHSGNWVEICRMWQPLVENFFLLWQMFSDWR